MGLIKKITSVFSGKKEPARAPAAPGGGTSGARRKEPASNGKKTAGKKKQAPSREEWSPGGKAGAKKTEKKSRSGASSPRRAPSRSGKKAPAASAAGTGKSGGGKTPAKGGGRKPETARRKKTDTQPLRRPRPAAGPEEGWDPSVFQVEPCEGKVRFHDLDLHPALMHAIYDLGWKYCTPIQAEILPKTLKGKDMAGRAQTGTGKTAAFLITIIDHCLRKPLAERKPGTPRALVIAPTRELAIQIGKDSEALNRYSGLRTVVVYGGTDYGKQQRLLADGPVDILVATPGRLLDFERQRVLNLGRVEIMVIDEADRMLDMGFIPDVRSIIYRTPPKGKRQTLLFSATLTDEVMRLASAWMVDPERVDIEPEQVAVDTVEQHVYIVTSDEKFKVLYNIIKKDDPERIMIFTNRRDQAERLADQLRRYGIRCEMLSGAVPQKKRMRILDDFRAGKVKVLVATDVAGRGIHIEGISHVVNYNIPTNPEDYVHRIGRTGRAGATGKSITFACEMESFELPKIEELLGEELRCVMPPEEFIEELPPPPRRSSGTSSSRGSGGSRGGSRGGKGGGRSGGPGRRGGSRRSSSAR